MQKICSNMLLVSNNKDLAEALTKVARELEVSIQVVDEWSNNFRINADVVVCDTISIRNIKRDEYKYVVLYLCPDDKISKYYMTFDRFIFDYKDKRQLFQACLIKGDYRAKVFEIKESCWECDKYKFFFGQDVYYYKGQSIYIRICEAKWLYNWLVLGRKDNTKRAYLSKLRSKYGKAFLKNVDIHGKLMEQENV